MRKTPESAVNLVKSFEGIPDGDPTTVNIDPYLDPVGIWTIGWGHAIVYKGRFLRGEVDRVQAKLLYPNGLTMAQCDQLIRADMMDAARDVEHLVKVPLTENQFAALVDFTFNLGAGNLEKSTLLRLLNAGDYAGAAAEFGKWNKAGGKILAGLVNRRERERQLFLG